VKNRKGKKMTKEELLKELERVPDYTEIYVAQNLDEIYHFKSRVIKDVIFETTNDTTRVHLRLDK
jgi:hypothetical protein